MPEAPDPRDRTPAQREVDHARLARLSETLVPALVQKLNASGLGELEVREGDWRIRLRRSAVSTPAAPTGRRSDRPRLALHAPDRDGRPARDATVAADAPTSLVAGDREGRRVLATSPAVGVFRPSAVVGARLRAGDRIGIVDLLGIPQEVLAPVDGMLGVILVQAGEAVEYGEEIAAVEADPDESPGADDESGEG
jgi:acetyl-CoA carboxylase biotin carboxyl carrier protein